MNSRDTLGWWIAAGLLTLLTVGSWAERLTHTGLGLRVAEQDGSELATYRRAQLWTLRVDAQLARELRPLRADWVGYWEVPGPGFAELVLKSDGAAVVELDGEAIVGTGPDQTLNHRIRRPISPGPHRLGVSYRPAHGASGPREVFLKGITEAGQSVPLKRLDTSPEAPTGLDRAMRWAGRTLPVLALFAWAALLARIIRRGERAALFRGVGVAALCLVMILAAALRFEALVVRYWGVSAPDWAEAVASDVRALRAGAFEHTPTSRPYEGDPFSYLNIARSMGPFYEPSAREPLFPALTRLALRLTGDRDLGINILSALASTLTCVSIFTLGVRLLSPWSGLLAALLWAIEWQVISFSVEGWRDDVFSLQVAACAAALVSLHLKPTRFGGIVLGIAGGLTLLTRLSALTFLAPGLVAAVLLPGSAPRRDRLQAAGLSALAMALLAGPFMAACAIGFGDPFYAVNVHASFYRSRAGLEGSGGSTALQFLAQSRLPWEFLETGFVGLTSYPFLNKWFGLGAWLPGLSEAARLLALLGLPVVLWRPGGAVALVVLFSSITPYAWTWTIPGGAEWRFTLPAYPFYLVSAAMAAEAGIRGIVQIAKPGSRKVVLGFALRWAATSVLLLTLRSQVHRQLDWLRVGEAIDHGRPALIEAGAQAWPFFVSGWRRIESNGPGAFQMIEPEARVRIPLKDSLGARIVLRLGASSAVVPPVDVFVSAERQLTLSGRWERGDMATLTVTSSHERKQGGLDLRFVRSRSPEAAPLVTLLWIRVEPEAPLR